MKKSGCTLYAQPCPHFHALPSFSVGFLEPQGLFFFRMSHQLLRHDLASCRHVAAVLAVPFHVATVSWGVVGGRGGGGRCGGVGDSRGKVMLVVLMGGDGTSGVSHDVVM